MHTPEEIDAALKKHGAVGEHSLVRQMAAKGRTWLEAEAARVKADGRYIESFVARKKKRQSR